ncbi:nucleotide-diphospho-sugar transferase [Delitschia confertaspora ATCC 74209]|uniref:Nucleotide-diphospho-sugar transferase n=1 Tax=Delitschia confertaspora ATCC 74209 TaxID=1513339 RepID=A0A9P4JCQ8_9PLEO|nr:nucleotide-diphospho-sugar transferase [Delitschia confertaspora ATCC 74209]
MRRKLSQELPRFVNTQQSSSFQWPRRSRFFAVIGLLFLFWLLRSHSSGDLDSGTAIQWDRHAYSLYATDSASLCHAVLILEALARFGSKADRVLFYPEYWDLKIESSRDRESQLLVMARDKYKAKLNPIRLLSVEGLRTPDAPKRTWDKSVTKFMAFSLTQYTRVIALDSDTTLLNHLDELFQLPPTPMAMPRAYWSDDKPWPLTSLIMVLQPNTAQFNKFKKAITAGADPSIVEANKYDMELLNERYADSALVLPHRPYALLTGEFRSHNHSAYLGDPDEAWDADKILEEAKLVHFSDWPLPKPWIMWPLEGLAEMQPDCGGSHEGTCRERVIWKGLYDDFRQRRRDVCAYLSVPAPDWGKIKGGSDTRNGTETEAETHGDGQLVHDGHTEAHSGEEG